MINVPVDLEMFELGEGVVLKSGARRKCSRKKGAARTSAPSFRSMSSSLPPPMAANQASMMGPSGPMLAGPSGPMLPPSAR